ncbi:MAG: DMT family protein [Planctomycetia bacterium]|nr:DMT family protein [Planctomycetia bacterium]
MKTIAITILLLTISNCLMTFAWYGHLKNMNHKFWLLAVLVSWGIAFFEYLFQVPANRFGATQLSLPQLKILQEAIALVVFVPFLLIYMKQPLNWNYLWAGMCIIGAVFFVFRN